MKVENSCIDVRGNSHIHKDVFLPERFEVTTYEQPEFLRINSNPRYPIYQRLTPNIYGTLYSVFGGKFQYGYEVVKAVTGEKVKRYFMKCLLEKTFTTVDRFFDNIPYVFYEGLNLFLFGFIEETKQKFGSFFVPNQIVVEFDEEEYDNSCLYENTILCSYEDIVAEVVGDVSPIYNSKDEITGIKLRHTVTIKFAFEQSPNITIKDKVKIRDYYFYTKDPNSDTKFNLII